MPKSSLQCLEMRHEGCGDVIKPTTGIESLGLSMEDSKNLLKSIQEAVINDKINSHWRI